MKLKSLIPGLFITILFGCQKSDDIRLISALNGSYSGTFFRFNDDYNNSAKLTLSFSDSTFSGTSESFHFPAICYGTYKRMGNKLVFTNLCVWTAEFDWSLILNGEWEFYLNKNQFRLWKEMGNTRDEYILTKN
jgi:hypothetical protein